MTESPSGVPADVAEPLVFLVVEDDATSRMLLQRALENLGYRVLLAENGETGVETFEAHHVDMVLMDLQMPGMDGYEATRQIKQSSQGMFVPVIFLTGTTDESQLARCVEVGGDDFLTKPYSSVILGAKIDALCRIRKLHSETLLQRDIVARHRARLISEQEVAEKLFSGMLNRTGAASEAVRCMRSPASIFNGDVVLEAETPSGGVRVLVGDFTGHGLQAAIGALPVTDIFRSMTAKGFKIADVVRELNRKLDTILPTRMFFACALVEFDPEYDRLLLWNGGMPDILVMDGSGVIRQRHRSKHLALGIQSNAHLSPAPDNVPMTLGDRVYLFSDGIIEAASPGGEMYGQPRLEAFITDHSSSQTLFEDLARELLTYTGNPDQDDDFTLVELRHRGQSSKGRQTPKPRVVRTPLHWSVELALEADTLREIDPLPLLMQLIVDVQGLQGHREKIYMVLAELFFNALDHGLLGLDSSLKESPDGFGEYYRERAKRLAELPEGRIEIRLCHREDAAGGRLRIAVEDSGAGFDFEARTRGLGSSFAKGGRGLALIQSLGEELVYSKGGACAEVSYVWDEVQEL